ncbi:MAG: hypothetical protein IPK82_23580 [Polyangiaceae bacterium]|nr:hypothetical protein [Polyangiaceae bacterium]
MAQEVGGGGCVGGGGDYVGQGRGRGGGGGKCGAKEEEAKDGKGEQEEEQGEAATGAAMSWSGARPWVVGRLGGGGNCRVIAFCPCVG